MSGDGFRPIIRPVQAAHNFAPSAILEAYSHIYSSIQTHITVQKEGVVKDFAYAMFPPQPPIVNIIPLWAVETKEQHRPSRPQLVPLNTTLMSNFPTIIEKADETLDFVQVKLSRINEFLQLLLDLRLVCRKPWLSLANHIVKLNLSLSSYHTLSL